MRKLSRISQLENAEADVVESVAANQYLVVSDFTDATKSLKNKFFSAAFVSTTVSFLDIKEESQFLGFEFERFPEQLISLSLIGITGLVFLNYRLRVSEERDVFNDLRVKIKTYSDAVSSSLNTTLNDLKNAREYLETELEQLSENFYFEKSQQRISLVKKNMNEHLKVLVPVGKKMTADLMNLYDDAIKNEVKNGYWPYGKYDNPKESVTYVNAIQSFSMKLCGSITELQEVINSDKESHQELVGKVSNKLERGITSLEKFETSLVKIKSTFDEKELSVKAQKKISKKEFAKITFV